MAKVKKSVLASPAKLRAIADRLEREVAEQVRELRRLADLGDAVRVKKPAKKKARKVAAKKAKPVAKKAVAKKAKRKASKRARSVSRGAR